MAYTRTEFIVEYPEFEQIAEAHVTAKLAAAALWVKEDVWGDQYEYALGLKTAVLLESSPFGFRSRPGSAEPGRYAQIWKELLNQFPRRIMVLG